NHEPYFWNGDFGTSSHADFDRWHKIEAYVNVRGTCTGSAYDNAVSSEWPRGNANCSDQMRVWVDDVLVISADDGNWAGGTTGANLRGLTKFWFFGNASATGAPVNYWIYDDNFCVGTSYDDCTQAPFSATRARAEFGGGDHLAPAAPSTLRVT